MFTKENIIKHTKILLFLLIFHFVLTTFIKFKLWQYVDFLNNSFINLWKDIYLLFIYILIIIYWIKNNKLKNIKNITTYIILLIILISLFSSIINFQWIKSIILGIKYDIWLLFPIIFYQVLDINKNDIDDFFSYLIKLIKITIILSLLFEFIRFVNYEILYYLWFWPIWNWKVFWQPPVLYQTWSNGVERFSGVFSWPNHLAFYFIVFWPIILISILNKKIHYIWWILYIILLIFSLSRSGLIAFFVEIFILIIFIFKNYKQYRKAILYLILWWFLIFSILWLYIYKSWKYKEIILRWKSTEWHYLKSKSAIKWIKDKILIGHGLGTAWPASYYSKKEFVPESWFLQIFYEIWILWWFVWFYLIFYLIYKLNKSKKITYPELTSDNILKIWICIGIIWLLVQWVVLHSFEDAMVVLPLFITIWILLSYIKNNDTKN